MAAVVHFHASTGRDLASIKNAFTQVHAIFARYNTLNPPTGEEFYAAIYLLRSALETLGSLHNNGALSAQAKEMCRDAMHLRHALIHGDSQLLQLVQGDFANFATGLNAFITNPTGLFDNPANYRTAGRLFSSSRLNQVLQTYGGG